jgi:hypothetical protein
MAAFVEMIRSGSEFRLNGSVGKEKRVPEARAAAGMLAEKLAQSAP